MAFIDDLLHSETSRVIKRLSLSIGVGCGLLIGYWAADKVREREVEREMEYRKESDMKINPNGIDEAYEAALRKLRELKEEYSQDKK